MVSPRVSVIIPTYNRAPILGRAINSVLAQTCQDFEIIVCDDCSTDNTAELAHSFQDSRIKFLRHEVNKGAPAARNMGIQAAQGEYVAFLDSDDEWFPEKLERQLELFAAAQFPNLGLVICGRATVDDNGHLTEYQPDLNGNVYERVLALQGIRGVGSSLLVKRKALDGGARFDEALPAFQDWDFLLQIAKSYQVQTRPESLVKIYHEGNRVWNVANIRRALTIIMDKYAPELQARPEALAYYHRRLAWAYFQSRDAKQVRYHLSRSLKLNGSRVRLYPWVWGAMLGYPSFNLLLKLSHRGSQPLIKAGLLKAPINPFN